jgi:hypothetical protein
MARFTGWTSTTLHGGRWRDVKTLIAEGSHRIEVWGSAEDGWQAFLVDDLETAEGRKFTSGCAVSPIFHRQFGDTRKDLKAAAQRAYGVDPDRIKRGRNWL